MGSTISSAACRPPRRRACGVNCIALKLNSLGEPRFVNRGPGVCRYASDRWYVERHGFCKHKSRSSSPGAPGRRRRSGPPLAPQERHAGGDRHRQRLGCAFRPARRGPVLTGGRRPRSARYAGRRRPAVERFGGHRCGGGQRRDRVLRFGAAGRSGSLPAADRHQRQRRLHTVRATLPSVIDRRGLRADRVVLRRLHRRPGLAAYHASKVAVEHFRTHCASKSPTGASTSARRTCPTDTPMVRDAKKDLGSFQQMLASLPASWATPPASTAAARRSSGASRRASGGSTCPAGWARSAGCGRCCPPRRGEADHLRGADGPAADGCRGGRAGPLDQCPAGRVENN